MNPEEPSIVYILGAGCSAAWDYPLADQVKQRLEDYASSLGSDCARIRESVQHTVEKMGRARTTTIDEFVSQDSSEDTVFDAKLIIHVSHS